MTELAKVVKKYTDKYNVFTDGTVVALVNHFEVKISPVMPNGSYIMINNALNRLIEYFVNINALEDGLKNLSKK